MGSKLIERTAGYLQGKIIIATPQLVESYFARSIVYIFTHNNCHTMGLIINYTFDDIKYSNILDQLNIKYDQLLSNISVYYGGPVESDQGFILYSNYNSATAAAAASVRGNSDIKVSSSIKLLEDIARGNGPQQSILAMGYSKWSPGQLEQELQQNIWVELPANIDVIFNNNGNAPTWLGAARKYGIDLYKLAPECGHS